jgi:hypothetical protein
MILPIIDKAGKFKLYFIVISKQLETQIVCVCVCVCVWQ